MGNHLILSINTTTSSQFIHGREMIDPLTPMSDQDRISPYNINTKSSRQVMRKKNQLEDYKLIQYQILQTNITRTACQTVRRITNEILGVKGLSKIMILAGEVQF